MRILLTESERAEIEQSLLDHDNDDSNERVDAWQSCVAKCFPFLRYWWEGMSEETAVRALLAHAEVEQTI